MRKKNLNWYSYKDRKQKYKISMSIYNTINTISAIILHHLNNIIFYVILLTDLFKADQENLATTAL